MRSSLALCLVLLAAASAASAVTWDWLPPPTAAPAGSINHTGTDGSYLYVVTHDQRLFRLDSWTVDPFYPTATWTELAPPPRSVCSGATTSGLAYQSGYLYTLALASQGGDSRTVLRYKIAADTWDVWQDADGQDINITNATCALRMDPMLPGVGFGMWHAGNYWCRFDWSSGTVDNGWMGTVNGWGSRNESWALDGKRNRYYATEQSWSPWPPPAEDDRIYTWTGTARGAAPAHVVQKPLECGFGQSVAFIPDEISPSGHDELWLIRAAGDFTVPGSAKHEGFGGATPEWSRYDFVTGLWSTEDPLLDFVDSIGAVVLVGSNVFIRSENYVLVTTLADLPSHPSVEIGTVKDLADDTPVSIRGTGIGAYPGDTAPKCYLESASRAAGIQVRFGVAPEDPAPAMGLPLVVSGTMGTDPDTQERYVQASDWWPVGLAEPVPPLGMNMRSLAGSSGLGTTGMLVKVAGIVKAVDPDREFVYISDGAQTSEAEGLRIDLSSGDPSELPTFRADDFAVVTGVSATYLGADSNVYPVVRIRVAGDVTKVRTRPPQVVWTTIQGPISDAWGSWCACGTEGSALYVVHRQEGVGHDGRFWKYEFYVDPTAGTWTQLADMDPAVWITVPWAGFVNSGDLAYQDGYFYARGSVNQDGWKPTVTRYSVLDNAWENWLDDQGLFITSTNSSGNALVMDPANVGRGTSVWHAGNWWVEFDWNAKTADNAWMSTYWDLNAEGVGSASWVSRNEDVTTDGNGRYYATHNDWAGGLSSGDVIYYFDGLAKQDRNAGLTICHKLTQKPWQAGCGQSIAFVPGGVTPTGHDELWVVRGTTGDISHEGWGTPTSDYARYDLVTGQWVATDNLPGQVGYTGKILYTNGSVFVRGVDAKWYVAQMQ